MKEKFEIPSCEFCKPRLQGIFGGLFKDDLHSLSSSKGCNFYQKGQTIFQEGTRPMGLYCLNTGKAKVFKLGDEGKEQIVRLAKEGDVLGYRSLISGEVYSASAEALDETCICFIPREVFMKLIETNKEVSLNMMKLLSNDLREAEKKSTELAQKPVRDRLAEALLMLKDTYGFEEDEQTINIVLTREDLANIVGTATESVIRLLSEFKNDGLIALDNKKIKILDMDKLSNTANLYS